jgi:hypothetical protein
MFSGGINHDANAFSNSSHFVPSDEAARVRSRCTETIAFILGIDLGTTFSVVAYVDDDGRPRLEIKRVGSILLYIWLAKCWSEWQS